MISEFVGWPVAAVAIGSAIVAFLLMLPLARKVKEHNVGLKNVAEEAAPHYTVGEMFRALRTNKYMLLLLSADVVRGLGLTQLTTGMFAAFFLFNNSLILTLPVLVAFVPGLIVQFFADRIVRRFGKRNTLLAAALLATLTGVVMFLLGPSNVTVVVALMAIMSIPGALIVVVMTFVVPDTIEYTRYKTRPGLLGNLLRTGLIRSEGDRGRLRGVRVVRPRSRRLGGRQRDGLLRPRRAGNGAAPERAHRALADDLAASCPRLPCVRGHDGLLPPPGPRCITDGAVQQRRDLPRGVRSAALPQVLISAGARSSGPSPAAAADLRLSVCTFRSLTPRRSARQGRATVEWRTLAAR